MPSKKKKHANGFVSYSKKKSSRYSFNIGGKIIEIESDVIENFPNSKLFKMIEMKENENATWIDVSLSWLAPVFTSMERFTENNNLPLDPFYRSSFLNQTESEIGSYLAIEQLGLDEYFSIANQFERIIKASVIEYYQSIDDSTNKNWEMNTVWQLEKHTTEHAFPMPEWNADYIFFFWGRAGKRYAFLDWSGKSYKSNEFDKSGLLVDLLNPQQPEICAADLCSTTDSEFYVISDNEEIHLVIYPDDRCYHLNKKPVFYDSNDRGRKKKADVLMISEMIVWSWVYPETECRHYGFTKSLHQFDRISEISLQVPLVNFEPAENEIIHILCQNSREIISTTRNLFKQFSDSPLSAKYASDEWDAGLRQELESKGYVAENHNYNCFWKLVNVMRMRQIVRDSSYNGSWKTYKPERVPALMEPAMKDMLNFYLIDEDDFYGPLDGKR